MRVLYRNVLYVALMIGYGLLGAMLAGAPARAQETETPAARSSDVYIGYGEMKVVRHDHNIITGSSEMLGRKFGRGFGMTANSNRSNAAIFTLGGRYSRFRATVGISSLYKNSRNGVAFTVTGKDKQGREIVRAHYTSPALHVGEKPVDIDLSVAGVEELSLSVLSEKAGIADKFVWWGDARLTQGGQNYGPDSAPNPDSGEKILKFQQKDFDQQLFELAAKLKKSFGEDSNYKTNKPTLALALFSLGSLPDQTLASKNAEDLQDDMRVELSRSQTFDLTLTKQSFSNILEQNRIQLGDVFDEKTRAALGKLVAAKFLLLGRISDRGEKAVITYSLYDLSTGVTRVDDKMVISLKQTNGVDPKEERHEPTEPTIPITEPSRLTLTFTPHSELRVKKVQWFMDGMPLESSRGRTISKSVSKGSHRFQLQWEGSGYRPPKSHAADYQNVTAGFDLDVKGEALLVQVKAEVVSSFPVGSKLKLTGRAGDTSIPLTWR